MNSNQPPIFRKSMHGYNKDDVNAYISNMSRMFFEKEKDFQASLASCSAKIQEDGKAIEALEDRLSAAAADAAECNMLRKKLEDAEKQLQETAAELEKLKAIQEKNIESNVFHDPISMIQNMASWDMPKDAVSDEISIRAGKIMVAAQNAAEAIVQKAQDEADAILRGANDRKEQIFHNITATADTVMTDISAYMKTAVDKCFQEIYGNSDSTPLSQISSSQKEENGQTI